MKRCPCCQHPHAGPRKCCPACLDRDKRQRAEAAAAGICTRPRCGAPPAPGRKLCGRCLAYFAASNRRRRERHPPPPAGSIVALLNDYDAVL